MTLLKRAEKQVRSYIPLVGTSLAERRAIAFILPHLRSSGWLRSITLRQSIDQDGKPVPWISFAAIQLLSERVRREFEVFEYGSGNSTLWWADHVTKVVSCEHNEKWFKMTQPRLPNNVTYILEPLEKGDYPSTIQKFGTFDIVIIDGRERVLCAGLAVDHLKEHGVIVFDNTDRERYQPAFDLLGSRGFRRLNFVSMGPVSSRPIWTSIFYREFNCLGV